MRAHAWIWWKARRAVLRVRILLRNRERVKRPARLPADEALALELWSTLVHRHDSELLYNPATGEAYLEAHTAAGVVYLFLEDHNLRIINTVVGYDVRLCGQSMQWAGDLFNREVHRRRSAFKAQALAKVEHSLEGLLQRVEGDMQKGLSS